MPWVHSSRLDAQHWKNCIDEDRTNADVARELLCEWTYDGHLK